MNNGRAKSHIFQFSEESFKEKINRLDYVLVEKQRNRRIPVRLTEENHRDYLHALIGGKKEYAIPGIGRADILTDNFVVEIKRSTSAIRALGQALCYGYGIGAYAIPIIGLFGKEKPKVNEICSHYGFVLLYTDEQSPWRFVNKEQLLRGFE